MIRKPCKLISEMECAMFGFLTLTCISYVLSSPASSNSKTRTIGTSCHVVEPLFYNSPLKAMIPKHPIVGTNLSICSDENSKTCCTLDLEKQLMSQVRENFRSLLYHNSRSVEGVLATTTRMLEDHMVELFRQSENKTLTFFRQVYNTMAVLSTEPIRKFYSEIIEQGTQNRDRVDVIVPLGFAVLNFFTGVFPLVYHQIVNPRLRDYSDDYKRCLRQTISEINPYGEVPKELSEDIGKTMKAVKVFLDALEIGTDVLNQTDTLFDANANDKCHTELLRMSSCPRCLGLKAKPCAGYCLNVLRRCLTQFSTQLDLPWSAYVDSLQKLVVGNEEEVKSSSSHLIDDLENLVRTLDTKISAGIMEAMTNGKQLEEKVKKICGAPQWSDDEDQPVPADRLYNAQELIDSEPGNIRVTPYLEGRRISKKLKESQNQLSLQLKHFLSSILKMRNFYANMAESLCSDDSFAETRDTADCWNGQMMGEYTKPVVAATVSAQKYNPEGKLSSEIGVSHLSDKLRSITQAIVGVLAPPLQSGDMYLQDEEGSGSEYVEDKSKYPHDDEEENSPNEEGSGSGEGPLEDIKHDSLDITRSTNKAGKGIYPTSSSQQHFTSWSLLISVWVCRRFLHFYLVG